MLKELRYKLEEYEFDNKEIDVDLIATFDCQKYVPASMYGGPDGLGWPAEGGEVELVDLELASPAFPGETELLKTLWKDKSVVDRLEDEARETFSEQSSRWD